MAPKKLLFLFLACQEQFRFHFCSPWPLLALNGKKMRGGRATSKKRWEFICRFWKIVRLSSRKLLGNDKIIASWPPRTKMGRVGDKLSNFSPLIMEGGEKILRHRALPQTTIWEKPLKRHPPFSSLPINIEILDLPAYAHTSPARFY